MHHQYFVTFAAVKIPDEILKQYGCSFDEKGNQSFTLEAREKLAAYILTHPNNFPFTTSVGNCVPMVGNGQQTYMRLLLDPKQEDSDFKRFGLTIKRFDVGINVQEEDNSGQVQCSWSCKWRVHLKEPIGGSTDQGGTGPMGCCVLNVGKPDLTLLFRGNGVSLWDLVALNREPAK